MTITRGVYAWGTGLLIPTDVTLSGTATDTWIFQIAQDLTVASATKIVLPDTGASINGRLLAQTAVSIDLSVVVAPSP